MNEKKRCTPPRRNSKVHKKLLLLVETKMTSKLNKKIRKFHAVGLHSRLIYNHWFQNILR